MLAWAGETLVCHVGIVAQAATVGGLPVQMGGISGVITEPDWRGRGIAVRLLEQMEEEMVRMGMRTAYTIARALSYGMNKTFGKMGYTYSGTLTNNSNISGRIESMTVWHKKLKSKWT